MSTLKQLVFITVLLCKLLFFSIFINMLHIKEEILKQSDFRIKNIWSSLKETSVQLTKHNTKFTDVHWNGDEC